MSSLFKKHARPSTEEETPAKKESKLFAQIDNIWEKNTQITSRSKAESVYMMNRFLSLDSMGFVVASECNAVEDLPEWARHCFLYYTLPKARKPWKKYPKLAKDKMSEARQRGLKKICDKFCVKEYHGIQIMTILEQQGYKLEVS